MQRYKIVAHAVSPNPPTGALVDHWKYVMEEDSEGDWVRYEDILEIKMALGQMDDFTKG